MGNELKYPINSHELAAALGLQATGDEREIIRVLPLAQASKGSLCFAKLPSVAIPKDAVVISPKALEGANATILISERARLDFARALLWIDQNVGFNEPNEPADIHETVRLGVACAIGKGVRIGAHTIVGNNVTIGPGVCIGERCVIKSGAVIGEAGFGFERDESGLPIRLVHLGGVVIGNDVEIGSVTTVCRGTLGNTILEDYVKVDDHVHVAHNVILRRASMIIACAELSGGVEVGERAWVGPNASVIQQRKLGPDSLVGIAANVLKDVEGGAVVVGNPAKALAKEKMG
ncbi:UDP-3-O-(3-hydroxymyristoyl)glucosamine N-acyltransferase [Frateuria sp. Soil773]|uniref:UDP-3-O-(3-hydroxymyristoyl)glucosamine N-acyltransferase n=1 Tax=Frateuria sp. Soil773 TaxID=1736407 RepID=UPI0009E8DDB0|nr:UDP-3-O-(3-hydroxymyristoyl)glucosamine N-acyltransferase [Frateuria sp. Soil773]